MQFKKVDVLISENLTKAQLKEKVLTELNKISKESNPSISYIANIHDIVNGKYWICMDSETKETMGATDELIDLQAIFRHTTENPDEASRDLLYSSKYIEDNFLRKIIFETYKEANDSRLNKLETTVGTNEKDIEDKHYKLERRVTTAENTIADNKELEDTRYNEYTQFKKNIENNILSINNTLNTKANLGGSETQVFNVADPTSDWHAINLAYAKKNFNADLINKHKTDFNNPHRTTISNLNDTTISTPKVNQVLVYDGAKWINEDVSLDDSNYAKKNEANVFTKKQSGIDGTEDANFVTLRQLKTKVGLTGNETIGGNKTFSSPIIIPNATANNHSLPLGQADGRYAKLLTQNLEWSVGVGGKFTNINDALSEASKYLKVHKVTGSLITLKLKSGFVFNEKIHIQNNDLNFVIIESEDTEVGINASSSAFGSSETSVLFSGNYAKLPVLRIMVDLDTKSAGNKKVVLMRMFQSYGIISGNAGCKNAAWDAVMVEGASTLCANGCIIENAGYDSIFCSGGSKVSVHNATIKGTTRYGILTRFGGYVTANEAKLIDQTQGTLLQCEGGIIYANDLVTTGSTATQTNITPNQPASSGIIFK